MGKRFYLTLIIALIACIALPAKYINNTDEDEEEEITASSLTEWQILEMAIMKTESEFNPRAVGGTAKGVFQITPIFVKECNRLAGEQKWTHEDALDPEKALEMFTFYQDYYNPDRDCDKAIKTHNPGAHANGYAKKVLANMNYIRNYEQLRSLIINEQNK